MPLSTLLGSCFATSLGNSARAYVTADISWFITVTAWCPGRIRRMGVWEELGALCCVAGKKSEIISISVVYGPPSYREAGGCLNRVQPRSEHSGEIAVASPVLSWCCANDTTHKWQRDGRTRSHAKAVIGTCDGLTAQTSETKGWLIAHMSMWTCHFLAYKGPNE